MNNSNQFDPRNSVAQSSKVGLGDGLPCVKCGAVALDTGLECDECGFDNYEAVYGHPFPGIPDPYAYLKRG